MFKFVQLVPFPNISIRAIRVISVLKEQNNLCNSCNQRLVFLKNYLVMMIGYYVWSLSVRVGNSASLIPIVTGIRIENLVKLLDTIFARGRQKSTRSDRSGFVFGTF